MSSDNNLQEMEADTKQSKTAVNAGAKPAEPMVKPSGAEVEDLGGPTPENYKPDDNSAALKTPGTTLKTVKTAVNAKAAASEPMKGMKEEEEQETEATIEEEEVSTKKVVAEEETAVEEESAPVAEYDIEEDVNALLGDEELSEEFKDKAKLIFESAVKSKVAEVKEQMDAQYEEKLVEQVAEFTTELSERVDTYLEYVAQEWFTENQLVIEQALKTEMTESFLQGMKSLFEEHYVTIPEEKYDVLESMVEKLDDMETKLNEQIEKNIGLNKRLSEATADGILDQISEGLATTQKEKLASLAEGVEFESETVYREKLETLKESYFSSKVAAPAAKQESLSEGVDTAHSESYSPAMAAYMRTMGSISK
jgi:hypothetical protein